MERFINDPEKQNFNRFFLLVVEQYAVNILVNMTLGIGGSFTYICI